MSTVVVSRARARAGSGVRSHALARVGALRASGAARVAPVHASADSPLATAKCQLMRLLYVDISVLNKILHIYNIGT